MGWMLHQVLCARRFALGPESSTKGMRRDVDSRLGDKMTPHGRAREFFAHDMTSVRASSSLKACDANAQRRVNNKIGRLPLLCAEMYEPDCWTRPLLRCRLPQCRSDACRL